jgi:lipoprotein signal peptidase
LRIKIFKQLKSRTVVLIIAAIIIADQALKYWVKTHMSYQEQIPMIGSWFRLFFIENEGMAWGWKFGGEWGKMALTLFRLIAVIFGVFYIRNIIKRRMHPGFIACAALIFAGALGNLIDSMFYGMIYSASDVGLPLARDLVPREPVRADGRARVLPDCAPVRAVRQGARRAPAARQPGERKAMRLPLAIAIAAAIVATPAEAAPVLEVRDDATVIRNDPYLPPRAESDPPPPAGRAHPAARAAAGPTAAAAAG